VLIQRYGGAFAWPAVATMLKAISVFIILLRVEAERD
jgi:hypothetical protein